jgi:hypothetical protein
LKGLGALVALIAAVVGVPILLHAVAGSPIPSAMPVWDGVWASLTARDDGTLLLGLLKYAAWAGWALFALSVVADLTTRMRGLPAPRLGPQQPLATQLVGAVLALAVSVPTALPATATPEQPASASVPAATTTPQRDVPLFTHLAQAKDTSHQQPFEEYLVRRGDCLWDIAWNELGEPERWPEIFESSQDIRQPDGRRLTDPDLIVTGWVLHIPLPADPWATHRDSTWRLGISTGPPTLLDQSRVVTPLLGPAAETRNTWRRPPDSTPSLVATPLRPRSAHDSSLLESRWLHAVNASDRRPFSSDWRDRVAGAYHPQQER